MHVTVLTNADPDDGSLDEAVTQVVDALTELGHRADVLDVGDDAVELATELRARRPGLVFNLAEGHGGDDWADAPVVGLLELMGIAYTGSAARALYITQQKVLTKKILAFEGIATPKFAVFTRSDGFETGGNLRLPLFVKPVRGDASLGIDAKASLVSDMTGLLERVRIIHEEIEDSALAEEFVAGREFYVGVLGNEAPVALPVVEMDFSGLPEGALHIADFDAKWEEGTAQFRGTRSVLADLPDQTRAQLQEIAVRAYRALDIHDYGRIDMRLTDAGEVFVLEANANCYLERSAEFARAAEAHGIDYVPLIGRIVELATKRKRHRGAHGE